MTVGTHSVMVRCTVRGDIPEEDREYALGKVGRVLRMTHRPVLDAHLRLGWEPDPAHPHPALLQIGLDLNGVPVQARIAAGSIREGADLLQERLIRHLARLQGRARSRRRWSETTTVSGGSPADARGHGLAEASQVLRRKTFAAHPLSADEAASEMAMLDHDFYLYTDQETGREAVVHRNHGGEGYGVMSTPAALSEDQARERLDLSGEPLVFYRDPDDVRGRVLYRRFDGGYGVISPV